MKRYYLTISLIVTASVSFSQTVQQRLKSATDMLLKDEQMKHAMMSLYVVETKTGKVIYHLNEQTGLAAASTQKIFTSVAALDLLGKDYRYKTELGYDGEIKNDSLNGNLLITGYGDPTLGSDRGVINTGNDFMHQLLNKLKSAGINTINGNIYADASNFEYQPIPYGWIWQDIGNYYGAGCWAINWSENEYSIQLKSGNTIGDSVEMTAIFPPQQYLSYENELKSANVGSGDNAYIYTAPYSEVAILKGTIPVNENKFSISGAVADGPTYFLQSLEVNLDHYKIKHTGRMNSSFDCLLYEKKLNNNSKDFFTYYSQPLDSINYWFLQKSINLYGEALLKTIAYEKTGYGSTDSGVEILKDFWSKNGIEKSAINIVDGSGLSPQNRVTTDALVKALQYAKTRDWYGSFYNALPLYNGMKIKSGTIGGAKAYAGYHTSKSGTEYTFAIIINNYDDAAGSIVPKMFKVLDELK